MFYMIINIRNTSVVSPAWLLPQRSHTPEDQQHMYNSSGYFLLHPSCKIQVNSLITQERGFRQRFSFQPAPKVPPIREIRTSLCTLQGRCVPLRRSGTSDGMPPGALLPLESHADLLFLHRWRCWKLEESQT